MSPASIASVSSHGATDPAAPRKGSRSRERDRGTFSVRSGEGVEQSGETAHVLTQVFAEPRGSRCLEAHRTLSEVYRQPLRTGPAGADRGVDDLPGFPHRLRERGRHRPAAGHQHQARRLERVGEVGHEPVRVGCGQLTNLADDDDPAIDQEGRRGARVEHRPDVQTIDARAAELLDDEGGVAIADESLGEHVGGLRDERGVVAFHQIDRVDLFRPCCPTT